jgi:aryl-alcohol dehydrogenase-like predicted oxidoreductase
MKYRHVGRSGLLVSEIAYGNWLTHGDRIDLDMATACVRAALDAGITTFDTADGYADSRAEETLGTILRGERREGIELCTKVYFPTGPRPNDRGLSRKHLHEAIVGSLRRLQTDYVDIYQAHRYDYATPLEETMQAFADIVHSGKVHYIGVSEWLPGEIRAAAALAAELKIQLVSNQPQYSMLWRVIDAEIQPTCEELGITQLAYSPLAQGALTGKYRPGQAPPPGSRAALDPGLSGSASEWASTEVLTAARATGRGTIGDWMNDEILDRVHRLGELADDAGYTMPVLAIAWVLQNHNVSSAIIGGSRPEQIVQNAAAAGVTLDRDLMQAIDTVLEPVVERDPTRVPVYPARP